MIEPPDTIAPGHRVLIVDDEPSVLGVLKTVLTRANYEVVALPDPLAAQEILTRQEFSVIISDLRMPGLSGLELLAEARRVQPLATRILMTAVLSLDTVIDAINQGEIYRFIVKPWLQEEFLTTVRNGVQRHELICQNVQLDAAARTMNLQLAQLNSSLEQQVKIVADQNRRLAEMNVALEQNLLRSMQLCVHTIHTFYPTLGNQVRRVSQLCRFVATTARLEPEDRRVLESSALLYDVGLVGVPRHIIKKWQEDPEALGFGERALVGQHPILGQELAAFSRDLDRVGLVIRSHHERFDGAGYPDKLAGDRIPWLARLLSVVIAYASCRLTPADALDKVKHDSGSAFDPAAVRIFLEALAVEQSSRNAREVQLAELQPGMVVARGLYSRDGRVLATEGQLINAGFIQQMLRGQTLEPIAESLLVYC